MNLRELGVEPISTTSSAQAARDRRNYWLFLFEGGFFVFGMGFVNMQSLLPALILEEGGPSWVAAYMPTIMAIGMFGIPMLNAGWIDRLKELKPFVKLTGFFQRIVYLVIGVILVWGGESPVRQSGCSSPPRRCCREFWAGWGSPLGSGST